MSREAAYSLDAAIEHMQRITRMQTGREWRITIRHQNPGGLTAHQTVEVSNIYAGFDWQAGQVIIEPAVPLVQLTPEELEQFRKSAKEGQSWHTYKITENYRKKAKEAQASSRESESLLRRAMEALEYHQEQTRPIGNMQDVIAAIRQHLGEKT